MLPDLAAWHPTDVATLCFIRRGGEVLLIRKKRGLGAGKINAPGGRLEPGESAAEAAVREVAEEVCVAVADVRERGVLRFLFADGYSLQCHVFLTDGCVGEPAETDEALPLWFPLSAIPYGEMWADDALWLPKMLAGYRFEGRFGFDGDVMTEQELRLEDPAAPLFARFADLGVQVELREHPPVFTVAEARRHRGDMVGMHVKNLFLRNKRGQMWLVTVPEDADVGLDAVAAELGAKHLSFASPERLRTHLGVEPGSVTPLGALADGGGLVTVAVAGSVLDAERVWCHPLTNDRSVGLSGRELARFLDAVGHPAQRLLG